MENHVCQSCGMPLYNLQLHGTAAGGMPIEDYCIHCYRDGGFTSDVTMEEMMRLCANYVDGNRRFYAANMRTLYPHLKRWAKKENTESQYYRSINNVIEYVKEHLGENAALKKLAGVANISPYHFHRIFRSVIGESLAEYVNRLRMEYVAEQLKTSALSLAQLADMTGYSSEQALSRAFKNYFDIPPKTFKATFFKEIYGGELSPRICKVAHKNVVIMRDYLSDGEGWKRLYTYAMVNRLLCDATESVEVIIDGIWNQAITTKEPARNGRHALTYMLAEGLYAIFTHKGDTAAVHGLYSAAVNYWLPKSKYAHSGGKPYIIYLHNRFTTPPSEQLTEVYIPLETE